MSSHNSHSGLADSDLLADALKQMDGILADTANLKPSNNYGVHHTNGHHHHPQYPSSSSSYVTSSTRHGPLTNGGLSSPSLQRSKVAVRLFNDLYVALGNVDDKVSVFRQLYPETQTFFQKWIADITPTSPLRLRGASELMPTNRSTNPDPHKLDLMAENSNLKVRLARTEKDLLEAEAKLTGAQQRINELQSRLNDRTIEVTELRTRLQRSEQSSPERSLSNSFRADKTLDREKTIERLKRKHFEVEKLKQAVESLVATNEEKDARLDEMQTMLNKYRRLRELVVRSQGQKVLEQLGLDADDFSDGSSARPSNASSNENVLSDPRTNNFDGRDGGSTAMPYPNATSTPRHGGGSSSLPRSLTNGGAGVGGGANVHGYATEGRVTSPLSNILPNNSPSTLPNPARSGARSNSFDDVKGVQSKTPQPPTRRRVDGFGTDEETLKDELAQQYKAMQDSVPSSNHVQPSPNNGPAGSQTAFKKKPSGGKGLRKLFGKMKRSNSQEFDDKMDEFKRAGLRSTAGPRLGWSKDINDLDLPFARWDTDRIALWLHVQGLSMYVGECKRWVKNGEQLLQATAHDLEKELGMRNGFHRKKLQLALQAISTETKSPVAELDHNWVTRWLDDIGLPQYKDQFTEARIDGRMLHYLTVDDLIGLRVTNTLHHLSLRRGIQVLRANNFSPTCLKRRPAPGEGQLHDCPEEVALWSNHRVMEWLRNIDLSEYAPNLRGSGVHGGIMVLEPRFGAEIFASILSIPASKTLLRRHLSTHFVSLIGSAVQAEKRAVETQPGYLPLTPSQKVKVKKNIFWTLRSDGKEDFVCPMDHHENGGRSSGLGGLMTPSSRSSYPMNGGGSSGVLTLPNPRFNDPNSVVPREEDEHLLAHDRQYLDTVPTSDV